MYNYCKEEGHKTYQCPEKGGATNIGAASVQRDMINCMTQQEADTQPDVVSGTFFSIMCLLMCYLIPVQLCLLYQVLLFLELVCQLVL